MSDLLKSLSAALTSAVVPSAAAGSAVLSASASAASLPPSLANLTGGSVIAGVVVDRGRGGIVLLKTDKGVIQLQTNLPLKIGADLVLEVQSVGAQLRFTVLSVDQHAPSTAPADPAPEQRAAFVAPNDGDGGSAARASAAPANSRGLLAGLVVTAEILAPPASAPRPVGAELIPALLHRVAAIAALSETAMPAMPLAEIAAPETLPAPQTATVATTAPATDTAPTADGRPRAAFAVPETSAPIPEQSLAGQPSPAEAATAPTAAPAQQVTIRILAALPQGPTASGPVSAARPNVAISGDSITLLGTVVADDKPSGVTLATPIGVLRLPVTTHLPAGSQIAFEVLTRPSAERSALVAEQSADAATFSMPARTLLADSPRDWPQLRALLAALPPSSPSSPTVADIFVPRPGPELGPAIMAFLASLKSGGNARTWLGPAASDALDAAGHKHLIDRLGDELRAQAGAASALEGDDWQTIAVPLAEGERLSEVRFHFQRKRKDGGGQNDSEGGRFIVEASLSALGPLQLDGRVQARRFDLVVRTGRALPEIMRRDISTLFADSMAGTDYAGGVSFRADIQPTATARRAAPRGAGLVV